MIRNIKHTITSLLLITCMVSCSSDFLDIEPEQNVSAEQAITDVNTLQTAINGVYSKLQSSDYYGRSMYVIPELMADNLALSIRNTGRYLDYDGFVVSEEDTFADGLWNTLYEVIVNASKAIEGGEKLEIVSGEQQEQINQLVGEAYALRALAHFDLVRLFAQPYNYTPDADHPGIPVINRSEDNEISPARNTVKEVYEQVNTDLAKALEKITADKKNGRFTSYAVKALAARSYLYQEDYTNAIKYSTEVIDNGGFSLAGNENYPDLWAEEFNSESIFEIVNTVADNAGTNGLGHYFDPGGYADALVTTDLFNLYDSNDARLGAIKKGSKTGAEENALFVYKFPRGTSRDDNVRILRLAEQFLIRAEAYAKTGKDAEARADLLKVMERATPGASAAGESGDALVDRILLERRKELAFEGHRLFDLNRNKKDVRIIQSENIIEAPYPNDKFILPIPLNELNANPDIAPQNPGY
ncbi:RagB/SusD family nutrient uptake outer membrane protein [Sinomicrobium pectinilyticum]|uniref:RagB/SusD family nutrient uptake outer membrane protein n=1 Tax=Sinomicrobium pectinilyticum TaxID=1084421 RepID=A0A3N0F5D0_SINP1|nr:RagB/SusD family nutrient uptake outer membrane protein [Sinomicrobium pectinilyticum]RNL95217.1 RagB/SusD family nutrient uptake outer membrane protein [Sinomicrobium pectinilyticum]